MSRFTWSGLVVAIVFVIMNVGFAQTPPTQVPRTPTPPGVPAPSAGAPPSPTEPVPAPVAVPKSDPQAVSVTGCLREASAAAKPAEAAAPAPPSSGDAAGKADPSNNDAKYVLADAVPSSTEASADAAGAKTYKLVANDAALTPHVGKKVELTGTIDRGPTSAASATPRLLVQSGKVLAETCTA